MKYWTRKTERDTIAALLEDDTYEDANALADAVLKTAWDAFQHRDWWLTIIGDPNKPTCWAYGLASTENEARKLALVGPARVVRVASAAKKLEELT